MSDAILCVHKHRTRSVAEQVVEVGVLPRYKMVMASIADVENDTVPLLSDPIARISLGLTGLCGVRARQMGWMHEQVPRRINTETRQLIVCVPLPIR